MIVGAGNWRTEGETAHREWSINGVGRAALTVDLGRGARLTSLSVAGHELLVSAGTAGAPQFRDGLFLMAPYAGRVRGAKFEWDGTTVFLPLNAPPHSAHGVVAGARWSNRRPGRFMTQIDPSWPFGGGVELSIRCRPTGLSLSARLRADRKRMPVSLGWHPWFRREIAGASGSLNWAPALVYREDDHITSRTLIASDTAITTWTAPADGVAPELNWPGMFDVRLKSRAARCWVVHETPDAICVEPQTAPGDAFNAGDALILNPGETAGLDLELVVRPAGTTQAVGPELQDGSRTPARRPSRRSQS